MRPHLHALRSKQLPRPENGGLSAEDVAGSSWRAGVHPEASIDTRTSGAWVSIKPFDDSTTRDATVHAGLPHGGGSDQPSTSAGPIKGLQDGDVLHQGRHRLRFWETPHVHHWDSIMVVEETTASLFPSDLFIQPNDQPPIARENLGVDMCECYRAAGSFGGADPVLRVVGRVVRLAPGLGPSDARWQHARRHAAGLHDRLEDPTVHLRRPTL